MNLQLLTYFMVGALVAASTLGFSQEFNHLRGQSSPTFAAPPGRLWIGVLLASRHLRKPGDCIVLFCSTSEQSGVHGVNSWSGRATRVSRMLYSSTRIFVAVKVDYDTSGPLVFQLERAQVPYGREVRQANGAPKVAREQLPDLYRK